MLLLLLSWLSVHAADPFTSIVALDGAPLPPETLSGHVVLVVNVASRCGFTHQYEGLQALHEALSGSGLVVLGVPSNQFGSQEPGTAAEIQAFCRTSYGVDFPMLEKQDINGPGRSRLYQQLIGDGPDVSWNFEKFLVGRDGEVIARYPPQVSPDDPGLRAAIAAAL
jgi:glutathione peroxidase-family protein